MELPQTIKCATSIPYSSQSSILALLPSFSSATTQLIRSLIPHYVHIFDPLVEWEVKFSIFLNFSFVLRLHLIPHTTYTSSSSK